MLATMHPEDIKAGLRKRYGTVAAFERAKGLPDKSVNEILRGRTWKKVTAAVEKALQEPIPLSYPKFRMVTASPGNRTV
jgi:lambda repressor-like predicted transcriptional regulator